MSKPGLHFAHANGFPFATYRQFLNEFSADYDVHGVSCLGHSADYPVDENWGSLVKHVIDEVETQPGPVLGIGHSLGGVLIYFAACRRPDLFKHIIVMDAPMFAPVKSSVFYLMKRLGIHKHFVPGKNALRRRRQWASYEEALAHFRVRSPFKHFAPGVLEDYVNDFQQTDDGVELNFHPEVEARVFDDMPIAYHRQQLKVPGHYIFGDTSTVVDKKDLGAISRRTPLELIAMEGSHLFVMEKPKQTAELIQSLPFYGG